MFIVSKRFQYALLFILILSVASPRRALAASTVAAELAELGLTHQVFLEPNKLIQEFHYSPDLSKIYFLAKKSALSNEAKADLPKSGGAWSLTVSSTKNVLLFSKGLDAVEVEKILSFHERSRTAQFLLQHFFSEAQAAETSSKNTFCLSPPGSPLNSSVSDILGKVSLTEAVRNCDFDVGEMLKKAVTAVIDTYTNLDQFSLANLSKVCDTIQYAMTRLSTDLRKVFAKLGEQAPKFVEGLICNTLKNHASGLVMAAVLPGGVKRIPLEIEKIVERLAEFANAPVILNLIEKGAFNPNFLRFEKNLSQLTETVSASFKSIKFHEKNLATHYKSHQFEFSDVLSYADYETKMLSFAKASGPNIVHLCPPQKRCVKFDVDTGEYLIMSPKGDFVSFFKVYGKTAEERMGKFLTKEENHTK